MFLRLLKRFSKPDEPIVLDERAYFDELYYGATYSDIRTAGIDGYDHFMSVGWREGRNPSGAFNTLFYRDRYLAGADINPLSHYVEAGGSSSDLMTTADEATFLKLQRHVVGDAFDDVYYQDQVGQTGQDLLTHYLQIGWKDGLAPNSTFDVLRYSRENAFIHHLGVSPLYHSVSQARLRFRKLSEDEQGIIASLTAVKAVIEREFDPTFYLQENNDVKKADRDPLDHFLLYGWKDGRNPTALFETKYYLAQNEDVAAQDINPFYHYLTIGRHEGRRSSSIGVDVFPKPPAPSAAAWADVVKAASVTGVDCLVIMPVYSGSDETLAAIYSVLSSRQKTTFALYVINDSTPDVVLERDLVRLSDAGFFAYHKNTINLGFIKSVNHVLRDLPDQEVVLLNSDTLVFNDWLDRLVTHARSDSSIATVTPFSNNSSACTYPRMDRNNIFELERPLREIDGIAAVANEGRHSDIAFGAGFCMYISRKCREVVGLLDEETFGYGYWEDVDFCLRASRHGLRHVVAEDVLVYHKGEVSFVGFAEALKRNNETQLGMKHPDHWVRHLRYQEADYAALGRMRLDLARLAKSFAGCCLVFISPAAATGALAAHIAHLEGRLRDEKLSVVHIHVGGGNRCHLEILSNAPDRPYCPNLRPSSVAQIRQTLEDFLSWLAPRAIHVHSLAGFDWLAATMLMDIVRRAPCPYFHTLHDYTPICHRGTLVPTNSRFCGVPDISVCRICVATDPSYAEAIDPALRRATYSSFLKGAKAVFAPSVDTKSLFEKTGSPFEIVVKPHEVTWFARPREPRKSTVIDIVVIGDLGPYDGARVLLSLARDAKARGLPIDYHLVGSCYLDELLIATAVAITNVGSSVEAIADRIADIGPSCILILSFWPEPHCDALSIADMLAIQPVFFDMRPQAERSVAEDFGFRLPYSLTNDVKGLNDALLALPYHEDGLRMGRSAPVRYGSISSDYYGIGVMSDVESK